MRKEKYWSNNSSSSSGRSSSSSSSKKTDQQKKTCRSSTSNGGGATTTSAVNGCMSAVFQLFDFNTHSSSSFRFTTSSSVAVNEETKPPGVEAPRNCLEVDETASLSSSNFKIEDSLSLKMGIQIKTKTDKRDSVCSEVSSSPGTRTPTLVARLMGLDLLPDSTSSSPRPSSTNASTPNTLPLHSQTNRAKHLLRGRKSCSDMDSGIFQSIPAKISLSRRSDVEHYRRPSFNKENTDSDLSRLIRKQVNRGGGEGLSSGHNARQIVKQVKETASRRSAMSDVTNDVVRRDQLVISNQLRREKLSRAAEVNGGGGSRLRFHREVSQKPLPPPQATAEVAGGRFLSRRTAKADAVMRNRRLQEETYVRRPSAAVRGGNSGGVTEKRCNKTTPLLSIGGGCDGGVRTVLPIKKDPSPPATKIPVKQQQPHETAPQTNNTSVHLSTTTPNTKHRHLTGNHRLIPTTTATATTTKLAELHYVSSIFKCMNITLSPNAPLPSSFTIPFIFSPKNPIFDDFRTRISFLSDTNGLVGLKCNQKLLLDLVEELTFDFFKPFRNSGARVSPVRRYGTYDHVTTLGLDLVNAVRDKVESFPRAECHALEDIDALIDVDPPHAAEEGGEVAAEIEGCIWNGLMQELVGEIYVYERKR